LKIYLNSFYNKKFNKDSEALVKIKKDLSRLCKSDVKAKFISKFNNAPESILINTLKATNTKPNKVYCFAGFRSICPVTSQPDFANIYFIANNALNISWLTKYFKSYRERGDFHEHCVESMFQDIKKEFGCTSLEVSGRFMRRGGIDINPTRSSSKKLLFKNFRFFNQ
jgi:7-cyano-7-deazaguanine reductase